MPNQQPSNKYIYVKQQTLCAYPALPNTEYHDFSVGNYYYPLGNQELDNMYPNQYLEPHTSTYNHNSRSQYNPMTICNKPGPSKILVNPHFNRESSANGNLKDQEFVAQPQNIYLNPSVIQTGYSLQTQIHVNRQNVLLPSNTLNIPKSCSNTVHVNPSILDSKLFNAGTMRTLSRSIPSQKVKDTSYEMHQSNIIPPINDTVYKSKNKLIRLPASTNAASIMNEGTYVKRRRNSVRNRFKIQKSTSPQKTVTSIQNRYKLVKSVAAHKQKTFETRFKVFKSPSVEKNYNCLKTRYKIIKSSNPKKPEIRSSEDSISPRRCYSSNKMGLNQSQYHLDNRPRAVLKPNIEKSTKRKYLYVDRFYNISHLANSMLVKQRTNIMKPGYIKVNGILYKKSPTSMKKANIDKISDVTSMSRNTSLSQRNSKASLDNDKESSMNSQRIRRRSFKLLRTTKLIKVSPSKLRKSNVPCPMYRKFGKCSGKDNGKCIKIHNPDQIVLCTRFLQGACLNKNCLLSHKISPEKMPTCKYYLEGGCSRDDCQYLHIKISPKADICRDFLQGFCKKATECNNRHQFLCPDFEKHGSCPKKRCTFPHGERVRKINTNKKTAKKSSDEVVKSSSSKHVESLGNSNKIDEKCSNNRYYDNQDDKFGKHSSELLTDQANDNLHCDTEARLRNRPKLGDLPTYIPLFQEKS